MHDVAEEAVKNGGNCVSNCVDGLAHKFTSKAAAIIPDCVFVTEDLGGVRKCLLTPWWGVHRPYVSDVSKGQQGSRSQGSRSQGSRSRTRGTIESSVLCKGRGRLLW